MITGIYQSASGLDSLIRMQEVIANNLANVSTSGFKKEMLEVEQKGANVLTLTSKLDQAPGTIRSTEAPFQLALTSEGYFSVLTPQGIAYTRDGNFNVDHEGRLITKDGHLVQGQKGEIVIPDSDFTVTESGEILNHGEVIDQLQIVSGDGPMRRLGNSLMIWEKSETVLPVNSSEIQIMQGALEGSNVNVMEGMVDMMMVMRLYEANQKAIENQDAAVRQVINEVGRMK